ncbi:acyltransferase [Cellulosilyticum ruminicola]|uniref:acyltransferase n=1 Tax=Cellulosilyticum ruminicola TaxID=425254 RepID=UPI0006D11B21|nr:acyltransferase family protein [Cellulosilyticum ruminicola]
MNTREKNLDLLRVFAAFLVVMLHTSVRSVTTNIRLCNLNFTIANLFNAATRVAVPTFVLLSGTFLLGNPKNKDFPSFYKKTFYKIVLPTFITSLIYMYYVDVLNYGQALISHARLSEPIRLNPLLIFKGPCFYHLWYMYMLIGLYMVVPLLIRLKERVGMKNFMIIGCIFLAIDMAIIFYNEHFWPIRFVNYIGYLILGYCLHYYFSNCKKHSIFIIIAIGCYLLNALATEFIVRQGYFETTEKKLILYGHLTPFVLISTICLFIYFMSLPSKDSKLLIFAPHTFNIYLVHAGILVIFDQLIHNILKFSIPVIIYIPIMSIVIFLLSYEMSKLINFVTQKLKNWDKPHIESSYTMN